MLHRGLPHSLQETLAKQTTKLTFNSTCIHNNTLLAPLLGAPLPGLLATAAPLAPLNPAPLAARGATTFAPPVLAPPPLELGTVLGLLKQNYTD